MQQLLTNKWGVGGVFGALAVLILTEVVKFDDSQVQVLATGGVAIVSAGAGVGLKMLATWAMNKFGSSAAPKA